jgi:hypothetical protein
MSITETHRPYEIYADAAPASCQPVETFNIENQKDRLLTASSDYISTTRSALDDAHEWVPFFAEKYNISANLKEDYVLVPVTIFLSDIPNKKGHAFTYQELTSADPYLGTLKYKTWEKKPCQLNHINKDISIAKGIILSASLQPAKSLMGDLYKLILLQAYDRRTWPEYTNQILSGEANAYSMGATAKAFKCSVCSGAVPEGRCGHIPKGMLEGKSFNYTTVGDKLAYVEAQDIMGFECSLLAKTKTHIGNNPANPVSFTRPEDLLRWQ